MKKTATYIRTMNGWNGDARLYKLEPALVASSYDHEVEKDVEKAYDYVIVSAVWQETYIFPAYASGKVRSWGELDGSSHMTMDHASILESIGCDVVKE